MLLNKSKQKYHYYHYNFYFIFNILIYNLTFKVNVFLQTSIANMELFFKSDLNLHFYQKSRNEIVPPEGAALSNRMCASLSVCLWGCVPSVSQAAAPSLVGQRRVSILRLPSWRSWGSARRALQVYLTLCSCLAPIWVTLTGYQGVHGVVRLTSAHTSKLHALYSWIH